METAGQERQTAVVIKALLARDRYRKDPLAEITSLAETAGIEILDSFTQKISRPISATYLGKGKINEAAERARELDVDVIITDNDLSPAQERNLERISDRTVIDRSQLIMDIFAQRAQTHQAKLQVELAQLRYTFPRLKRLWTHLSRYEGGIGMRGPGETQLETDKRLVNRKIQRLRRELKEIAKRKETSVEKREQEFVVALVGYTNAGKSTLLNALTSSDEFVEDKLFATLETRVRRWELAPNRYVLLTDTVGFIRDLPHHLVASFHSTLAETRAADLLFHVVDASSDDAPWQIQAVQKVLGEIECREKESWLILNKWDSVPSEKLIDARGLQFETFEHGPFGDDGRRVGHAHEDPPPSHAVSARQGLGLDDLRDALIEYLKQRDTKMELKLPHVRGDVLSYIRENAEVDSADYQNDGVLVSFSISPAREARLRHLYPEGFAPRPKESWE